MSIIYNGFDSKTDFDLCIASKEIPTAVPKYSTESVPYMSGAWVFPQNEYEPINIKYTFSVTGENKRDLNTKKHQLDRWIKKASYDKKLFDTDISSSNYFFVYIAKSAWEGESDEQATFTAEFMCYPFMFSPVETVQKSLTSTAQTIVINNDGDHTADTAITTTGSATVTLNSVVYSFSSAGTYRGQLTLQMGENSLSVKGTGTLTISYQKELFG
ncbi:MAG: phage tail family protein [Clostridia bacterium]|nr:phage tail family protein [Clostridia bacterium]